MKYTFIRKGPMTSTIVSEHDTKEEFKSAYDKAKSKKWFCQIIENKVGV